MNPNQGQPQPGPQQININPEDTTGISCANPQCGGNLFMPMFALRRVSALISPTGREEVIQVPVMTCAGCGLPYTPEAEGMVDTSTPDTEGADADTDASTSEGIFVFQQGIGQRLQDAFSTLLA